MRLKKYFTKLYPIISYIFKTHLLALLILSLIRFILLLTNLQNAEGIDTKYIVDAFYLGFFIDNIVVSFVSFFPIVFSGLVSIFANTYKKAYQYGYNAYFIIIYTLIFGLSVADIPYFNYFLKHLDVSVLDWLQFDSEGYSMILNESGYIKYYILFFAIVAGFSTCIVLFSKAWRKYKSHEAENNKRETIKYVAVFLIFAVLCSMGLRRKHGLMQPIFEWTAYLNPNFFVNELTVNPMYNYMLSLVVPEYKDVEISFALPLEQSIELLKKDFKDGEFNNEVSPISRLVRTEGEEVKANVVIVLMESMSSYYLDETPHLTPYLNQLKEKSLYFENFYSVSTHTNQGVFSTLYGFPAFFEKNIMEDRAASGQRKAPLCEGLPYFLKEKGYDISFFMTHEKSYNNMDMFLYRNGYDMQHIYSKENYPESKLLTSWGICDDYLFEYALETFNKQKDRLFFGTIMTISNHPDYYVPEEFMNVSKKDSERAVYFADYSIGQFMENAQNEDWYNNTIFVFAGDHGRAEGNQIFQMPLSLNHVPLFIYSPLFEDKAERRSDMGTQTDIFPTIMGLLNIEYENNTLGIDLLKEKRPYAVFTTDSKLGCINEQYLYCYNTVSRQEILYDYKKQDVNNIATEQPLVFDSIRNYASATVQVTNYLFNNDLTRKKADGKE